MKFKLFRSKANRSPEQDRVATVASALHEDWRQTRRQADGNFEPRVKTTKDEAWVAAHGTDQVDIANTAYGDLPADWQAENKAAATVVVRLLGRGAVNLAAAEDRERAGSEIHDEWLARNDWARGGNLDVPFSQLPPDEQAKDIAQVAIAQQVLFQA